MDKNIPNLEPVATLENFQTCGNDEFTVEVVYGLSIVCAAISDIKNAKQTFESLYSISLPAVGNSVCFEKKKIRFLRIAFEQLFFLFEEQSHNCQSYNCIASIPEQIQRNFYLTDQSDAFVILRASGSQVFERLKFVSLLDLDNFSVGNISRSLIEHQGHYIMLESENSFLFLTPRSSADSFAQMLAQLCFLPEQ